MNKKQLLLIGALLICICVFLTGFTDSKNDVSGLLKERTGIFKLLQYGELTQEDAKKQLYKIETASQLEADLGFVNNFDNTEVCKIENMYIKTIERTSGKSGYEVYDAVIDWEFENNIYESIDYVIILKKIGKNYKIAKISVFQ